MQVCKLLLIQTGVTFPVSPQPLLNNTPTSIFQLIKALWAEKFLQDFYFFFQLLIHYLPATASELTTTIGRRTVRRKKEHEMASFPSLHWKEGCLLSYPMQQKSSSVVRRHSEVYFSLPLWQHGHHPEGAACSFTQANEVPRSLYHGTSVWSSL